MTRIERASKSKALGLLASRGSWADCHFLLSELGAQAWREQSLMGPSPEALAFERALTQGDAPPWSLLSLIDTTQERARELEARALAAWRKNAPSARIVESVAGYLGAAASNEPWSEAFIALANTGSQGLAGWSHAMGEKSRSEGLSRGWRSSLGLWRCAAKVSKDQSGAFVAHLAAGNCFAPLLAAAKGSDDLAVAWIESLESSEALSLLGASVSSSNSDWIAFKSTFPIERRDDGVIDVWDRRLAKASGGQMYFHRGDRNELMHLLRELWRPEAEGEQRGWDKAMKACARKAAPELVGNGMESARDWLRENALPELALLAMDGFEEEYDFEALNPDESVELMARLAKAGASGLAKAAGGCAKRLGRALSESLDDSSKKALGNQVIACAKSLWACSNAEGFEALILGLSEPLGSSAQALRASGFPFPALSREWAAPGSPGHLIALLRLVPAELADDDRDAVWGDVKSWARMAECLWERVSSAAIISALENGVERSLLPSENSSFGSLVEIDVSSRPWQSLSGPEDALKAWESAIEAVAIHVAKVSSLFQARDGIARSGFAEASRPPLMKADEFSIGALGWRIHAANSPEQAASWLVEQWGQGNQSAINASKICEGLDAESKKILALKLPCAFEKWSQSWGAHERNDSGQSVLAEACRLGAMSLCDSTPDGDAFGVREALCSACMACAAYGMALVAGKETMSGRKSASFYLSAKTFAPLLPQAVLAIETSWRGSDEGYAPEDLGGKAAWGALCFESLGVECSQVWMERWRGVNIKAGNPWVESCLCSAFTTEALSSSTPDCVLASAAEASMWLEGFGAKGLERPKPGEHSALERAVDCRMSQGKREGREEEGCHGAEVVKFLIDSGATPSCAAAPRGMDALAICSKLERKESPSSVMKALAKSPLANPGAGALLSILCSSKHGLSAALADSMSARALAEPSLPSLARVGAMMPDIRAGKALSACFGQCGAGSSLVADLLGAMAVCGADASACASVRMVLEKESIVPSESSARMLSIAAWSEFKKEEPPYDCERKISRWLEAGADAGALPIELIPTETWKSAWRDLNLGGAPCLGEAILSRAWACDIVKSSGSIGRAASWARIALALPHETRGPRYAQAARACLSKWQTGDAWSLMGPAISSEDFAELERCALDEGSGKSAGPSRRL